MEAGQPPAKWRPGQHALGVTCRGCGRKIPLFKVAPGIAAVGPEKVVVTCAHPSCRRAHEYVKSDLREFIIPVSA